MVNDKKDPNEITKRILEASDLGFNFSDAKSSNTSNVEDDVIMGTISEMNESITGTSEIDESGQTVW